ncbi:hypothetical protein [Acinetobacter baumannii]|nr:hypothetical protein [Acinetobacter baumannii]MCG9272650.1 hypothetical protein [Acinetobacter baumannii]
MELTQNNLQALLVQPMKRKKVSTKTTSNYIKKEALISLRASFLSAFKR